MRLSVVLGSVVLLSMITGCGEKRGRVAPITADELGVIINISEEEVNSKFSNTKAISRSEVLPFTEIMDASVSEVQAAFPDAKVAMNSFVKTSSAIRKKASIKSFSNHHLFNESDSSSDSKPFTLRDCVENREALTPLIDFVDEASVPRAILESHKITLTSRNSEALNNKPFQSAWVVVPPQGSLKKPELTLDKEVDLDFDMAGVYQVNLFLKQGVTCNVQSFSLPVTSNPALIEQDQESIDERVRETFKGRSFSHENSMGIAEAKLKSLKGEGKVLAILDSGVNYNSPFFAGRIWKNPGEKFDGSDTDSNQLEDDVMGYDFVNDDAFPMDDNGHGSHVAGLAAGTSMGVASKALIMSVKVLNALGTTDTGTVLAGLTYAILNGADVINLSLGAAGIDPRIEEVLLSVYEEARRRDILIVAAAGNGDPVTGRSMNIDRFPIYPASLGFDNILTVGASDESGDLTYYSNFGKKSVDLLAMGGVDFDIETGRPVNGLLFSAYLPNPSGQLLNGLIGTSMAAPLVSGMATLIRAENENLVATETIDLLKDSVDVNPRLEPLVATSGIVNIDRALEMIPAPGLMN